jgi:hypothetical protein
MTFKILAIRWCELFGRDRDQQQLLNDLSTKFQLVIFCPKLNADDVHAIVPFCQVVDGSGSTSETELCQRVKKECRRLGFKIQDLFYLNADNKPNPETWVWKGSYESYKGIVRDNLPLVVLRELKI